MAIGNFGEAPPNDHDDEDLRIPGSEEQPPQGPRPRPRPKGMEEDIRRRQRILFVGVVAGIFAIIVAALIYRGMKQSSSGTASKGRVVSAEQEAEQARAAQLKARWEMIRDMRTSFADEPVWIQELAGADSQFCEAVFRWYEIDRFVERELGGAHPGSFGLNAIEVFQLRQDRALGFVRAVVLALRDLRDNKVGPKTACNFLLRERGLTQSPSKREFLEEAIAALRKVGLTPEQLQAGDKGLQTSTEEFRQLLLTAVREETAVLRPKWRNGNKNAAATLRQFLSKYRFSPEEIGLNDWEAKRLQLVHYPN